MDELRRTGTVLVAEDNPASLAAARDMLESSGYRVRVSVDGEAALNSLRAERPDLVLLDIHMPKADGYTVCAAMKADPALSDVPVVFLSGIDEEFNKIRAFELGAADYLVKPIHRGELLARISVQIEVVRSRLRIREDAERLKSVLEDLRAAGARLVESEKAAVLSAVSAGLSHELNNPLSYIASGAAALDRNFRELLRLAVPGPGTGADEWAELAAEIPGLLEGLKLGADRAVRIVRSLRSLEKRASESKEPADLADLARRAVSSVFLNTGTSTPLETNFAVLPRISCRPRKIMELFYNLLANAVDATKCDPGAWIRVDLEELSENGARFAAFTVRDSGTGIPREIRNRIFDPFFTTKEAGSGAGLGLSIARSIARDHGGEVLLVESDPLGATFRVLLPLEGVCYSSGTDNPLK